MYVSYHVNGVKWCKAQMTTTTTDAMLEMPGHFLPQSGSFPDAHAAGRDSRVQPWSTHGPSPSHSALGPNRREQILSRCVDATISAAH